MIVYDKQVVNSFKKNNINMENQSKTIPQICEATRENMWQRILRERQEKRESVDKNYRSIAPIIDKITASEQVLKSNEVVVFTPAFFHSGK